MTTAFGDIRFRGSSGNFVLGSSISAYDPKPDIGTHSQNETLWNVSRRHYSGLMLAARITLPHFSVSSVMSVLKSAGEPPRIMPPRSASCVFILGSTRPALTSLLSLSIIPGGVPAGAPKPKYRLDS